MGILHSQNTGDVGSRDTANGKINVLCEKPHWVEFTELETLFIRRIVLLLKYFQKNQYTFHLDENGL